MKAVRGLLVLVNAEGLVAFVVTLFTRSESGRAVVLWLSRERILLLGLVLLVWGSILAGSTLVLFSKSRGEKLLGWLDDWCVGKRRLGAALIFLFVTPILLAAGALAVALTPLSYAAYRSWAPDTFPLLHALVLGLLPLLLFVVLARLELGAFLAIRYRNEAFKSETWGLSRVGPFLLVLAIATATIFQWIVLGFQLRAFVNLPAWYWKIEVVPAGWNDVLFAAAIILILAAICWVVGRRRWTDAALVLTFALGWLLQVGVGFMAGGGIAAMAERYFTTYHKTYVQQASASNLSIVESIRQYETAFGTHSFTSTKPPGLMAFYIGLDHLVNGHPTDLSPSLRYARLSMLIEFSFPILAAGLVFLIFAFARRHLDASMGWVFVASPLLYVLCPNAALFSLFPDQAVYPLVFLLATWFIVFAIRRRSIIWAVVLGLALYLAVFFAFTMLPLYPFAVLYALLYYWRNRGEIRWTVPASQIAGIVIGTLALYLVFILVFNYNFLPRFEKTITINHNFDFYLRVGLKPPTVPESASTRILQALNAAWFNNLDFAAAIGFPIYALFVIQGIHLIKQLFTGRAAPGEIIFAGLFLSFIILSLAGTAQGEVPRLWLFWLPTVVILAALELRQWAERRPLLLFGLGVAQFITIFLTFHFQDLRM